MAELTLREPKKKSKGKVYYAVCAWCYAKGKVTIANGKMDPEVCPSCSCPAIQIRGAESVDKKDELFPGDLFHDELRTEDEWKSGRASRKKWNGETTNIWNRLGGGW